MVLKSSKGYCVLIGPKPSHADHGLAPSDAPGSNGSPHPPRRSHPFPNHPISLSSSSTHETLAPFSQSPLPPRSNPSQSPRPPSPFLRASATSLRRSSTPTPQAPLLHPLPRPSIPDPHLQVTLSLPQISIRRRPPSTTLTIDEIELLPPSRSLLALSTLSKPTTPSLGFCRAAPRLAGPATIGR